MKKILFILAVALGSASFSQAQDAGTLVIADSGAVISVDKEVHDYGTVKNGSDGTCIFTITNNGSTPLIISKTKGSCGCTVPSRPEKPIQPGESAEILVKYDTKRKGDFKKTVTITSNAVNEPIKVVRIQGTVLPAPEVVSPVNNEGPSVNR